MLKLYMEEYARGKSQEPSEFVHLMFTSAINWLNPEMHPLIITLGHNLADLLRDSVAIL